MARSYKNGFGTTAATRGKTVGCVPCTIFLHSWRLAGSDSLS